MGCETMIYVITLLRDEPTEDSQIKRYRLAETLSESIMVVTADELKDILLNSKMQVINAKMQNYEIQLKDWVNKLGGKCQYTLMSKNGDIYKVASHHGYISKISSTQIKKCLDAKEIANCTIVNKKIRWEDTYEIAADEEFKQSITSKYEIFMAKASMIGYGNISFDYEIENQQVKLTRYTGKSRDIILPNFITAITTNAFKETAIKTLNLNEGLRIIGSKAFSSTYSSNGLESVEIPSTVELIGPHAFLNNSTMLKANGHLNMHKIKLLNDKTIILDTFS